MYAPSRRRSPQRTAYIPSKKNLSNTEIVRELQKEYEMYGREIKVTEVYEELAHHFGFKNWNLAAADDIEFSKMFGNDQESIWEKEQMKDRKKAVTQIKNLPKRIKKIFEQIDPPKEKPYPFDEFLGIKGLSGATSHDGIMKSAPGEHIMISGNLGQIYQEHGRDSFAFTMWGKDAAEAVAFSLNNIDPALTLIQVLAKHIDPEKLSSEDYFQLEQSLQTFKETLKIKLTPEHGLLS